MTRETHILPMSAEADFTQHNIRRRAYPKPSRPPNVELGHAEERSMRYALDQSGQVISTIRAVPRYRRPLPPLRRSLTPVRVPYDVTDDVRTSAPTFSDSSETGESVPLPTPGSPRQTQQPAHAHARTELSSPTSYRPKYRAYVRARPAEDHERHRYQAHNTSSTELTDTKAMTSPLRSSSLPPVLKIPRVRPPPLSTEYGASIAAAGRRAISRTGRRYRTAREILNLVEEQKEQRILRATHGHLTAGHGFTLSRFNNVRAKVDSSLRPSPPASVR